MHRARGPIVSSVPRHHLTASSCGRQGRTRGSAAPPACRGGGRTMADDKGLSLRSLRSAWSDFKGQPQRPRRPRRKAGNGVPTRTANRPVRPPRGSNYRPAKPSPWDTLDAVGRHGCACPDTGRSFEVFSAVRILSGIADAAARRVKSVKSVASCFSLVDDLYLPCGLHGWFPRRRGRPCAPQCHVWATAKAWLGDFPKANNR